MSDWLRILLGLGADEVPPGGVTRFELAGPTPGAARSAGGTRRPVGPRGLAVEIQARRPAQTILLVDGSGSMGTADRYFPGEAGPIRQVSGLEPPVIGDAASAATRKSGVRGSPSAGLLLLGELSLAYWVGRR
jgi:hypothetical protein